MQFSTLISTTIVVVLLIGAVTAFSLKEKNIKDIKIPELVDATNKSKECQACLILVGVAETVVKVENINATAIEDLLNQLCANFGQYKTECDLLVDTYGDKIAQEVASDTAPATVCDSVIPNVCPASEAPLFRLKNNVARKIPIN